MFDLELRGLTKHFGDLLAVDRVSLQVPQGELISLLGPSGCGKTTILRMITGFLRSDGGDIVIRGRVTNRVAPHRRDIAMVYQNYALFPHLTVAENVAFGLRMRNKPADEVHQQVGEALELVHLSGLEGRYPMQLSGGQQQRVALARAIVVRPAVLLLDEPLSNLDAKLRLSVRAEIRELQLRLGMTAIFVTHDQEEALSISDHVVVMNKGRIEQIGTPEQVYEHPTSQFVMNFVGSINLFNGRVAERAEDQLYIALDYGMNICTWLDPRYRNGAKAVKHGDAVLVGVRPEKIGVAHEPACPDPAMGIVRMNNLAGSILEANYLGAVTEYRIQIAQGMIVTTQRQNVGRNLGAQALAPGQKVFVNWDPACGILLPLAEGGDSDAAEETKPDPEMSK